MHANRSTASTSRAAFTLIELVIVLLILGILTVVTMPNIAKAIREQNVDAAARRIAADLETARQTAKATGASRSVQFDVAANQYTLLNIKDINHPAIQQVTNLSNAGYAVTLGTATFNGTNQLTFDLYGRPFAGSPLAPLNGGTIVVQAGSAQHAIVVNPTTGKTQIQ